MCKTKWCSYDHFYIVAVTTISMRLNWLTEANSVRRKCAPLFRGVVGLMCTVIIKQALPRSIKTFFQKAVAQIPTNICQNGLPISENYALDMAHALLHRPVGR